MLPQQLQEAVELRCKTQSYSHKEADDTCMRLSCLKGPPMTYMAPRLRICQSQEAEADKPTN